MTRSGHSHTVAFRPASALALFSHSQTPLCRLKNGVSKTRSCPDLRLCSNEASGLESMVASVVIHMRLKLCFKFPLYLYFPLMGDRKKWGLVDGPIDCQSFLFVCLFKTSIKNGGKN